MRFRYLIVPVAVALTLFSCADNKSSKSVASFDSSVATRWFTQIYASVATEKLTPLVGSRLYAYTSVALYETAVAGSGKLRSLSGQVTDLRSVPAPAANAEYDWPTAVNSALWTAAKGLFGASATAPTLTALDALQLQIQTERTAAVASDVITRSVDFGNQLGDAIVAWAATDGFTSFHNCAFTAPTGAGLWIPTPPGFRAPLEPCWGSMRPFALASASACDAAPPTAYSETVGSDFHNSAKEVSDAVRNLTADQKAIALFWADDPALTGTPPGHWVSIVSQVAASRPLNLEDAAEAYGRVGLAVGDAFISCWHTKFLYNLVRPITYINKLIDPTFVTIVTTPPFASYTSGHSTSSGAASFVLTDFLGDIAFTDHTHDARGLAARSFTSFTAASQEAAVSRLYGGIHYRFDNDGGLTQGQCVGQNIKAKIQFHR